MSRAIGDHHKRMADRDDLLLGGVVEIADLSPTRTLDVALARAGASKESGRHGMPHAVYLLLRRLRGLRFLAGFDASRSILEAIRSVVDLHLDDEAVGLPFFHHVHVLGEPRASRKRQSVANAPGLVLGRMITARNDEREPHDK